MYKLALIFVLALFVNANELKLNDGLIVAHTEVFGDSQINPQTKAISAKVNMQDSIETLRGEFEINPLKLVSDNKDRDEHMYEVLHVKTAPTITFSISNIQKENEQYKVNGILKMNNISKAISSMAIINDSKTSLTLNGNFSINLTEFNLEPPSMLFVTVRDQIDIKYNFNFNKGVN